jgi:hypothetical protein
MPALTCSNPELDLLHQLLEGGGNLVALLLQEFQLSQQPAQFKLSCVGQKSHTNGLSGLLLELFGFLKLEATPAGVRKQSSISCCKSKSANS